MELRRAGDVLLRQQLLLTPAVSRLPYNSNAIVSRHCRGQQNQCRASRHFATTAIRCEEQRAAKPREDSRSSSPLDFPSTPSSSRSSIDDDLSSLLDGTLDMNKGSPFSSGPSRTSRFASKNAQANNPPSRGMGIAGEPSVARSKPSSSVDTLLDSMTARAGQPQDREARKRSSFDISSMLDPLGSLQAPGRGSLEEYERPPMKLGPKLGRTVQINLARNMDVARAFRTLGMQCQTNRVRQDMMRQRFHERPGLKRKRLKRERWRKNFKNQFKETVQMVQRMKRQGW